ncbi:MAG: hypothetical protein AAF616_10080 [Bacteroidota bacterium]
MIKYFRYFFLLLLFACEGDSDVSPSNSGENTGTGGSLARFTISGDYLYAVDAQRLLTFSLEEAMSPKQVDLFELDWGVETIFAMDTLIFVGTQTGMHVFDITERSRPGYLSGFEHVESCDPVVAQDTLAFVTLRSGNSCRNGINRLDVLDVRDLRDPKLIRSIPMQNPHGLAVRGKHLFVCEGQFGMKVFEIQENAALEEIEFYSSIRSKDVILSNDSLMVVVADDGLFQYDYSDVSNISLLSQIRKEF